MGSVELEKWVGEMGEPQSCKLIDDFFSQEKVFLLLEITKRKLKPSNRFIKTFHHENKVGNTLNIQYSEPLSTAIW